MRVLLCVSFSVVSVMICYFLFSLYINFSYRRIKSDFVKGLTIDSLYSTTSEFVSHSEYEPGFINIKRTLFAKSLWSLTYIFISIPIICFSWGFYKRIMIVFTFILILRIFAERKLYKRTKAQLMTTQMFSAFRDDAAFFLRMYRLPYIYQIVQLLIFLCNISASGILLYSPK